MTRLTIPDIILGHIERCAAKGMALGPALASIIGELGPIQATHMPLGHSSEPLAIMGAGGDFVILEVAGEDGAPQRTVAHITAIEWFSFDQG